MRKFLEITYNSFVLALYELSKNKLRTFLSLFGVTIGIFCIIGVLATVGSLEKNIQDEIKSLGNNTLYLDKWDYTQGGGNSYPWWKYIKRPLPKYAEMKEIKERSPSTESIAFKIQSSDQLEYNDIILSGIQFYGVSEEFNTIQPFDISQGRYLNSSDFERGNNVVVLGYEIAEKLFDQPERAIGKVVSFKGKKGQVVGVIKKQGSTMIGGWQFDKSMITSYRFARTFMDERKANPLILVKGNDLTSSKALKDELTGTMRAIHKLKPTQDDDFSLNDVNDFSDMMSQVFSSVNVGGWAIAILSLIVGMFGVANIMFVTVRERTSQIGLKKAIGAKRQMIMIEFLLESSFLCIIGGMIGLLLVFILTQILTHMLDFPIYISVGNLVLSFVVCITVGVLAGIIPASQAAKMDPVVAIRS
jgi:putative ABC transport system permease protein